MPARNNAIAFRPPDATIRQLAELAEHYRALTGGLAPNQSQIVIKAIDSLHRTVCRPARGRKPRPVRTVTE